MNLDKTLDIIKKKYGTTSILRGNESVKDVETVSTTSINLDNILGGGIPKSFITEVFGKEGTGKSTLAAHIVAQAQKKGGICAYIDHEGAVNTDYFKKIGVDMDNPNKWLMCQPTTAEESLGIIETLIESNEIAAIVVDSVPAMIPEAVLNGEIGDQHIAQLPRLLSRALPGIISKLNKTKTILLFINQLRDNIGVMGYGPKTITPGGHALRYYSNVRIELSRTGAVKDGENIIGSRIKAKIIKNKVAPPFRECEYSLIFGKGISKSYEIMEKAIELDIFVKKGSWISYNDKSLCQGTNNLLNILEDDSEFLNKIEKEVYELIKEK